jgi:DNA-binding beta-propeller fold protein YncE
MALAATAGAADSVYWSNFEGNDLGHAALTGGGADIVPTPLAAERPYGAAIDAAAGKIYWGDQGTNTIKYANLDGSGSAVLPTGAASVDEPNATAVDPGAGRIYWANGIGNTIAWANLDGSGGGDVNIGSAPVERPYGIAIDPAANRIYWANFGGTSIGYANLDGTGSAGELALPAGLVEEPDGLAIDRINGRIYWTNFESGSGAGTIGWADLNGVAAGTLPVAPGLIDEPTGLAIDPFTERIYWANEVGGTLASASLDGSGGSLLDTSGSPPNFPAYPSLLKAPQSTAGPTLSGGASVGATLTCKPGTWAADLVESFLYRAPQTTAIGWTLNGSTLNGATAATLTVTQPGSYACQSIATNGAGSTTVTSSSVNVAAASAQMTPVAPAVLQLTKVKLDKHHGTATVLAKVSGPGMLTLTGKNVVRRTVKASGVGIAKLKVVAKGKALKALRKTGKVRVGITVKFVATEGATASTSRSITLRRRLGAAGT